MQERQLTVSNYFDISVFQYKDIFDNITYPWEALAKILPYIETYFSQKKITGNYKEKKNILIGEGTTIQAGVEIVGPAIIGKNCSIGHVSLLRDGCIIGDNVHIGHAIELKHSIVLNNIAIAHLNYVGDSIIGNDVNISGGSIVANLRLDQKTVVVKTSTQKINTGLQKFGAIIGDGSNIGVNAVLNPGTLLGKQTTVYPLTSVTGVHEKGEIII